MNIASATFFLRILLLCYIYRCLPRGLSVLVLAFLDEFCICEAEAFKQLENDLLLHLGISLSLDRVPSFRL